MKVYLIDILLIEESLIREDKNIDFQVLTDEEFVLLSSKYGTSYSLRGFENACNQDDFNSMNSYIRFIE